MQAYPSASGQSHVLKKGSSHSSSLARSTRSKNSSVFASRRATQSRVQPQLVPIRTWPHSASSVHPRIAVTSASKTGENSSQVSITPSPVELDELLLSPVLDELMSPVVLDEPPISPVVLDEPLSSPVVPDALPESVPLLKLVDDELDDAPLPPDELDDGLVLVGASVVDALVAPSSPLHATASASARGTEKSRSCVRLPING